MLKFLSLIYSLFTIYLVQIAVGQPLSVQQFISDSSGVSNGGLKVSETFNAMKQKSNSSAANNISISIGSSANNETMNESKKGKEVPTKTFEVFSDITSSQQDNSSTSPSSSTERISTSFPNASSIPLFQFSDDDIFNSPTPSTDESKVKSTTTPIDLFSDFPPTSPPTPDPPASAKNGTDEKHDLNPPPSHPNSPEKSPPAHSLPDSTQKSGTTPTSEGKPASSSLNPEVIHFKTHDDSPHAPNALNSSIVVPSSSEKTVKVLSSDLPSPTLPFVASTASVPAIPQSNQSTLTSVPFQTPIDGNSSSSTESHGSEAISKGDLGPNPDGSNSDPSSNASNSAPYYNTVTIIASSLCVSLAAIIALVLGGFLLRKKKETQNQQESYREKNLEEVEIKHESIDPWELYMNDLDRNQITSEVISPRSCRHRLSKGFALSSSDTSFKFPNPIQHESVISCASTSNSVFKVVQNSRPSSDPGEDSRVNTQFLSNSIYTVNTNLMDDESNVGIDKTNSNDEGISKNSRVISERLSRVISNLEDLHNMN